MNKTEINNPWTFLENSCRKTLWANKLVRGSAMFAVHFACFDFHPQSSLKDGRELICGENRVNTHNSTSCTSWQMRKPKFPVRFRIFIAAI